MAHLEHGSITSLRIGNLTGCDAETSDAELIRLAQECAQDSGLIHLGELTRVDADDLIRTLKQYRYYREIQALDREAAMV